MKKRVSLKNLFENGILCLEFGGTIKFHGESDNEYDLINDTTQEVVIRNDEQLEFGEWCHDETGSKFIVGTSDSGKKVYFSKEEYDLVVSGKRTIELVIRDGEKAQTSQTFGITLVEKPNVDGLTKAEVMEMYDQMNGDEAYPLEINGSESSAMGFITPEAAEILNYDYQESGLNDFVAVILDDMNNESEDGTYEFRGIRIHLSR